MKEPIQFFKQWFQVACETPEILEPNAMCLATATKYIKTLFFSHLIHFFNFISFNLYRNGIPSSRFVLMKGITDTGITFFTNYGSRKAKELVSHFKYLYKYSF